ncbi:MAG TPA: SRPBCC family protein [Sphingobium sp.]|uniref:SRPBCC family protein n=1 Tax=Sphingobium sp. TaxID=1912891 RepID=UPI002ED09349
MADSIERTVTIASSVDRVWNSLTDHEEFGAWFGVELDGPFVVGETSTGHISFKGNEIAWNAMIVAIEPMTRFAYTWHPYAVDPSIDYSTETPTLVEFHLKPASDGTILTVIESGFERIPSHRREEALRMNMGGWTAQIENIRCHVED